MLHHIKQTPRGHYYNAYGQRLSKSVALMLMECNAAYLAALKEDE